MEGRECDCPGLVTRCAHLENGHILALLGDGDGHTCKQRLPRYPYAVMVVYGWRPCHYNKSCKGFFNTGRDEPYYAGFDEAAALAAFYEAEEELLKGRIAV